MIHKPCPVHGSFNSIFLGIKIADVWKWILRRGTQAERLKSAEMKAQNKREVRKRRSCAPIMPKKSVFGVLLI